MKTISLSSPSMNFDLKPSLTEAIAAATQRLPPLYPLEHFVAVNPFLGLREKPFAEACGILRRTTGTAPVQAPEDYLEAWKSGQISPSDLASQSDAKWTTKNLVAALEKALNSPLTHPIPTFADLLDQTLPHAHWSRFVTEEISKWCGVHFDRNQTTWVSPWRGLSLFEAWKSGATYDAKPEAFGLPKFRKFLRQQPDSPTEVIERAWSQLAPAGVTPTDFFHRQLLTVSGWAGHLQYLAHEDQLRGQKNEALTDLLAIRLIYDAALHHAFFSHPRVAAAWQEFPIQDPAHEDLDHALARWQAAYERSFQKNLATQLTAGPSLPAPTRPPVQAIFCIDVRSEIIRRHLETALPGAQTLGFAGFFGFPVAHQTAHACHAESWCPALLAPPVKSRETPAPHAVRNLAEKGAWKAFQNSAASCFTFVESIGLTFGAQLLKAHDQKTRPQITPAPELFDLSLAERTQLAAGALRGMSLTHNFARLVVLCGHGSHSANNPFASSLDCGACGGHAGDVNARLAAATFNDPEVRAELAKIDLLIPEDTHFLAARHDTLSDDFLLYDLEKIPPTHQPDLAQLQGALAQAGASTRQERSPRLGLAKVPTAQLDQKIRQRGTDLAQLRPEWALANNAALIAAPRSRSQHLKLDGRVFLHEYDPALDPESQILTAILTAPAVVASWINLQYYGSRINPDHLCAGNKTIHQILSGIGVIEGNAGDLKSGLPMQSIHNGQTFVHEPRRLTVIIDNTPEKIDSVLDANPSVRELFDHQWIHLVALTQPTPKIRTAPQKWTALGD